MILTREQKEQARDAIAPLVFCSIQCYTYASKVQDCGYFVEDGGVRSGTYDSPVSRSDSTGDPLHSFSTLRAAAEFIQTGRLSHAGKTVSPSLSNHFLGGKANTANPMELFSSLRSAAEFMGTTSPSSVESEVDPLEDRDFPSTLREWLEGFGQSTLIDIFESNGVEFIHIILGGLEDVELVQMGVTDSSVRHNILRNVSIIRKAYSHRTRHDVLHVEPLQQDDCFADLRNPFE